MEYLYLLYPELVYQFYRNHKEHLHLIQPFGFHFCYGETIGLLPGPHAQGS